jgi:hypothetical protein
LEELVGQLGVRLPDEYASFLTQVGRGGAGPGYGLFPLRRVDGRWEGDGADITDPADLVVPFPYDDAVDPRAAGLPPEPQPDYYGSVEEYDTAMHAHVAQCEELIYGRAHTFGAQYLTHLGCAYRHLLIVSGPQRGTIWADDRPGGGPLGPERDATGARLTFARWYLNWLDDTEDKILR